MSKQIVNSFYCPNDIQWNGIVCVNSQRNNTYCEFVCGKRKKKAANRNAECLFAKIVLMRYKQMANKSINGINR